MNLSIIKVEFFKGYKSVLAWGIGFGLYALMMAGFFESISDSAVDLEAFVEVYPEALADAFGITNDLFVNIRSFYNTYMVSFLGLSIGIYAVFRSVGTLGLEIANHSMLFLITKPVRRFNIFLSKYASIVVSIFAVNTIIALLGYVGIRSFTNEDIGIDYIALITFSSVLAQLTMAALGMILGLIFKGMKGFYAGMAGAFLLYMLNGFSSLEGLPEWIKYLTPFYYMDTENIVQNNQMGWENIITLVSIIVVLLLVGMFIFQKKDIRG